MHLMSHIRLSDDTLAAYECPAAGFVWCLAALFVIHSLIVFNVLLQKHLKGFVDCVVSSI